MLLSILMQNIGLMEIDVVTRPVRIHAAIVVGVAIIVYMRFITLMIKKYKKENMTVRKCYIITSVNTL